MAQDNQTKEEGLAECVQRLRLEGKSEKEAKMICVQELEK